jgi:hypothetical protein
VRAGSEQREELKANKRRKRTLSLLLLLLLPSMPLNRHPMLLLMLLLLPLSLCELLLLPLVLPMSFLVSVLRFDRVRIGGEMIVGVLKCESMVLDLALARIA